MTNEQVIKAAANCKQAGINRLTFNIVGMPLETAENMRKTLKLNQAIAPEHFFFFPYIPLRGTPLYNTAKEEGLLLTNKKNLHYLSAANDRQFTLNMKECPELLSAADYNEICMQMLAFQERNNRLSYTDGDGEPAHATVEDKSFNLVEDEFTETRSGEVANTEIDPAIAQQQQSSLLDGVKNLFRS